MPFSIGHGKRPLLASNPPANSFCSLVSVVLEAFSVCLRMMSSIFLFNSATRFCCCLSCLLSPFSLLFSWFSMFCCLRSSRFRFSCSRLRLERAVILSSLLAFSKSFCSSIWTCVLSIRRTCSWRKRANSCKYLARRANCWKLSLLSKKSKGDCCTRAK